MVAKCDLICWVCSTSSCSRCLDTGSQATERLFKLMHTPSPSSQGLAKNISFKRKTANYKKMVVNGTNILIYIVRRSSHFHDPILGDLFWLANWTEANRANTKIYTSHTLHILSCMHTHAHRKMLLCFLISNIY